MTGIRKAIKLAGVGKEGQLLTDVIPSLQQLLSHQDKVCVAQGKGALNRFHFVFCNFCQAVSSIALLVLFLDDLQWGTWPVWTFLLL